ncbi:hypothetical protein [Actinoplanes teichomyceticus]|uniref:Lipoprotein n=1 Tax=Actinoplanes teichomyceticus TaxID=1867 RepID=A0A561VIT8_ACTTI|nr:hypothetical protein [Actinoplanes teichomyceticus]TWG11494.1 hypothetical protein FHX34_106224 [Actinoplanes teichomyceticus]GIF15692.1 hypothetical protein Ate01nite_57240 [Actinoplanes teichomyceticus]
MRRRLVTLAVALLLTAGCGTHPGDTPGTAGPARSATAAPAPEPSFADLTRGDTRSVVKMYAYDARNRSAVVEPILFMTGEQYCRAFRPAPTDGRCDREWTTEESHTKITVPVAARPRFYTWQDENGDVCVDSPDAGGTCPTTAKAFGRWLSGDPGGMVAVTMVDGTITRMAQIYVP